MKKSRLTIIARNPFASLRTGFCDVAISSILIHTGLRFFAEFILSFCEGIRMTFAAVFQRSQIIKFAFFRLRFSGKGVSKKMSNVVDYFPALAIFDDIKLSCDAIYYGIILRVIRSDFCRIDQ